MKINSIGYVLLAVQRALLGVISPELRAVMIDFDQKQQLLFIRIYYHEEVSEEILELWECAITEASADLGPDCLLDDGIERLDFPQEIPFRGRCVFLRKE